MEHLAQIAPSIPAEMQTVADKTEELAQRFTEILKEQLSPEQWAEMKQLNSLPDYAACCASHNYVDANMVMAQAFSEVHGRQPDFWKDSVEDFTAWNAAWDLARKTSLQSA